MPVKQAAEHAEEIARVAQGVGYGGAGLFAGFTLADIDLLIRIAVGVVTLVSLSVHLYFKIKSEKAKK